MGRRGWWVEGNGGRGGVISTVVALVVLLVTRLDIFGVVRGKVDERIKEMISSAGR